MIRPVGATVTVLVAGVLVACTPTLAAPDRQDRQGTPAPVVLPGTLLEARHADRPLAGTRIALDPGHQLGNHNFPRETARPVPAGGFRKPCNSTGTATRSGYPEATFNFRVAQLVKADLEQLGATVLMTRSRNSEKLWGPCVNRRGAFGARVDATIEVSLHADGSTQAGARGFHVIAPTSRKPWTDDIAGRSLRLAKALRAGLDQFEVPRATYLARGTALVKRSDLGTLNLADVPTVLVELGNMRDAADARRMKTKQGRAIYAAALVRGIRSYLRN